MFDYKIFFLGAGLSSFKFVRGSVPKKFFKSVVFVTCVVFPSVSWGSRTFELWTPPARVQEKPGLGGWLAWLADLAAWLGLTGF